MIDGMENNGGAVDFDTAVAQERTRRMRRKTRGHAYHYWQERGDEKPPYREHWCGFCAGYFGVPHEHTKPCSFVYRAFAGDRQCACIECIVADSLRLKGHPGE